MSESEKSEKEKEMGLLVLEAKVKRRKLIKLHPTDSVLIQHCSCLNRALLYLSISFL